MHVWAEHELVVVVLVSPPENDSVLPCVGMNPHLHGVIGPIISSGNVQQSNCAAQPVTACCRAGAGRREAVVWRADGVCVVVRAGLQTLRVELPRDCCV